MMPIYDLDLKRFAYFVERYKLSDVFQTTVAWPVSIYMGLS